jgi:hypothetical protein
VVAVSAASAGLARADPGDLDPSFSGNGKVVTTLARSDFGEAVAVQANGKIVVAASASGRFAVVRYTARGRLDSTFGNNGTVRTKASTGVNVPLPMPDAGNHGKVSTSSAGAAE